MSENQLKNAQTDYSYTGKLQINVTSTLGMIPIQGATVSIS